MSVFWSAWTRETMSAELPLLPLALSPPSGVAEQALRGRSAAAAAVSTTAGRSRRVIGGGLSSLKGLPVERGRAGSGLDERLGLAAQLEGGGERLVDDDVVPADALSLGDVALQLDVVGERDG